MAPLDVTTLNVLRGATCQGNKVFLNQPQLPRPVYEGVNEVLVRLRGKWKGGRTQAHVFPYDPRPLLEAVIESGEMPPKNPTAFFATLSDVIQEMFKFADAEHLNLMCEYGHPVRILEPSAGTGAIADAIREHWPNCQLDLVELLDLNANLLRRKGYEPHEGDFLAFRPEHKYDLVLMNPPFSVETDANAYIAHIKHAYELLASAGVLVSVAPQGFTFRTDKQTREFFKLVGGFLELLPDEDLDLMIANLKLILGEEAGQV
ncbi:MAG: class I SAM-dependent methyltransferase [Chloroflexi bacterium]|nr:class I SAM-dependent methyltransferase [Chloroflexota bacterium]